MCVSLYNADHNDHKWKQQNYEQVFRTSQTHEEHNAATDIKKTKQQPYNLVVIIRLINNNTLVLIRNTGSGIIIINHCSVNILFVLFVFN